MDEKAKEALQKQMELLSECSIGALPDDLYKLALAIVAITKNLLPLIESEGNMKDRNQS